MSTQRTKERSATGESEQNCCPECDGSAQRQGNETICIECGLVLEEDLIDRGPEWRAYDSQERQEKSRVGSPMSIDLHDKGLSTKIGPSHQDGNGNVLSSGQKDRVSRLKEQNKRTISGTGRERGLRQMFGDLHRMSSALDFPRTVRNESALIIRKAREEDLIQGRSYEAIATAALLIGSRKTGIPYTLDEVVSVSLVGKRKVRSAMRKLRRELDLKVPPLNPTDIVDRMMNKTRYDISEADDFHEFKRCVRQIVEDVVDHNLHAGKDPVCIVSGAIYFTAKKRGLAATDITQARIANELNVTKVSVRQRYKEIEDELSR